MALIVHDLCRYIIILYTHVFIKCFIIVINLPTSFFLYITMRTVQDNQICFFVIIIIGTVNMIFLIILLKHTRMA
jgi:hypothetical protein